MTEAPQRIALSVSGFASGGVPRVMSTLAHALAERGFRVDLLAAKASGPALPAPSPRVRVVDLAARRWFPPRNTSRRTISSVPEVARYLRRERPAALLSGGNYPNLAAVVGRDFAQTGTPLVVSHHANLALESQGKPLVRWSARRLYPRADAIVAVSHGVAEELTRTAGIPAERITTIYNPVTRPEIAAKAAEPLEHAWFEPGQPPVVLSVGRLHVQKDLPTLLRAFARVRSDRPARLLVLGEGKRPEDRDALIELAAGLGVAGDVALPGYTANPFAYMARAAVFVLSSAWEGLPTALIEALACGCPVVSTDCPSGPAEILEHGKIGPLAKVGDDAALARAVLSLLDAPPDPSVLRARAEEFSVEAATTRYLDVLRRAGARLDLNCVAEIGSGTFPA